MNVKAEIKKAEDSLTELVKRIMSEPLDPINKSTKDSLETLLDAKDKLDEIESIISGNANFVEDMAKSLRRSLEDIKDDVLPYHTHSIQEQFKALSEESSKKIQDSINTQQQSIDSLKFNLNKIHDIFLGEIRSNQEQSQRACAEIARQDETILKSLEQSKSLIENSSSILQNFFETNLQTLLKQLSKTASNHSATQQSLTRLGIQNEANEKILIALGEKSDSFYARLIDIEKSNINTMGDNQTELTRILAEQNLTLTANITEIKTRLKTLTITTGVFVVSLLGYLGYGAWSNLN